MAIPIAIARVGEGRAANRVGASDHAAGRTGHANVRAWRSGRRPKNGDISPIRCDRQSVDGRASRVAHAKKRSTTSMR